MADELKKRLGPNHPLVSMEGYATGWWILLDFGDVVVHVMQEEARAYYDLDHLWVDAPRIPFEPTGPGDSKARAG